MSSSFLQGVLLGLGLTILVGPILFILVQVSLERGYKAGLLVAGGVWVSDFMYMAASFLIINMLGIDLLDPDLRFIFAMIGGTVLLAVGVGMFMKKAAEPEVHQEWGGKSLFYFLSLGWSTNTFNPFTVFFWFTIMATNLTERGASWNAFIFILGVILPVMFFDSVKVLAAHKVRSYLKPSIIAIIRKISASVIMAFGVWLIITGVSQ